MWNTYRETICWFDVRYLPKPGLKCISGTSLARAVWSHMTCLRGFRVVFESVAVSIA